MTHKYISSPCLYSLCGLSRSSWKSTGRPPLPALSSLLSESLELCCEEPIIFELHHCLYRQLWLWKDFWFPLFCEASPLPFDDIVVQEVRIFIEFVCSFPQFSHSCRWQSGWGLWDSCFLVLETWPRTPPSPYDSVRFIVSSDFS